MNSNKVIGGIVLVLVVVLAMFLALSSDESAQTATTNSETSQLMDDTKLMMETEAGTTMEADGSMMMESGDGSLETSAGTYTTYSADKLAMAESGDVVLFFKADWCPSCRALDANITSNLSNIPAGVTILEVNYDTATELKQRYGVTTQHTLVQVDANGELVKKWSGGNTLNATLAQVI